MIKQIKIDRKKETPGVLFQIETGEIEIKGRSFPAEGETFYRPLIDAVDEITSDKITVRLEFEYANTSTTREIVKLLKKIKETGKKAKVIFTFEEGDNDMEEFGEDLEQVSGLTFIYITNPED
jgi:hypothetical protein